MSFSWVKNQLYGPLPEEQLGDIPNPRTEMGCHVTIKTTVTGAMIGTLAVGPAVAWSKGERSWEGISGRAEKYGKNGALIGFLLGAPLAACVLYGLRAEEDGIRDRCYRVRFNRKQLRIDRWAGIGALAGYGAAVCLGERPGLGSLLGLSAGTLLAGFVLNPILGYGPY